MNAYHGDGVATRINVFYKNQEMYSKDFNSIGEAMTSLDYEHLENASYGHIYILDITTGLWHQYGYFTVETDRILITVYIEGGGRE